MSKTLHAPYCDLLRDAIARLQERQHDLAQLRRQTPSADTTLPWSDNRRTNAKQAITQADESLAQAVRAAEEALYYLDLDAGRIDEDGNPID